MGSSVGHARAAPAGTFETIRAAVAESCLAHDLSRDGIDAVARLGLLKRYRAGDLVIEQDATDSHLLILSEGHAEVTTYGHEPLYRLHPGMPFGEVALLDEKPRSATVRATEDSVALLLPAAALWRLIATQPTIGVVLLRNLARVVCARVRTANRQIAALMTIEELHDGGA